MMAGLLASLLGVVAIAVTCRILRAVNRAAEAAFRAAVASPANDALIGEATGVVVGTVLALDDEMKKRDADGWCGVQLVNLASGDIVQWIRIEGAVSELYDVAVLPGVRRPMVASFTGPEINDPLTFEA